MKKFLSSGFHPVKFLAGAAFLSKPTDYLLSPEAVTDSTVLVSDRTTVRSLSAKNPGLLENRLLKAYDYFVVYRSLHISATCHTARQRLAQGTRNLASGLGRRATEGVELDVRNEELASEVNITIFTASRLLYEWQRKGMLTKSREKVVVRSPEALMLNEG